MTISALEAARNLDREDAIGGAGVSFETQRKPVLAAVPDREPAKDADTAPKRSVPQPPAEAEDTLGPAIGDIADSRLAMVSERRADAFATISRALKAGGHPEHSCPPAAATLLWSMADIAIAVMDMKQTPLDGSFRQASSAEDRAKADAVAKAIATGSA